jgi:hypothetical protein
MNDHNSDTAAVVSHREEGVNLNTPDALRDAHTPAGRCTTRTRTRLLVLQRRHQAPTPGRTTIRDVAVAAQIRTAYMGVLASFITCLVSVLSYTIALKLGHRQTTARCAPC